MAGDTHYDVLGAAPTAEPAQLRKAYVDLARTFHPDFHASASAEVQAHAESMMRIINTAWDVLGSPPARAKYDKQLKSKGLLSDAGTATPNRASTDHHRASATTSGSAPPRWLTMLPALFLAMAIALFAVGMVTGLPAVLAGAIGSALLGGLLFAFVPMVALKRAARGMPDGPTVRA